MRVAGLSQQQGGVAQRIGEERLALLRGQIGHESRQGVALRLGRLAHDGGADNQPQGIEGYLGAVAVGVGDTKRLQEAVIMSAVVRLPSASVVCLGSKW